MDRREMMKMRRGKMREEKGGGEKIEKHEDGRERLRSPSRNGVGEKNDPPQSPAKKMLSSKEKEEFLDKKNKVIERYRGLVKEMKRIKKDGGISKDDAIGVLTGDIPVEDVYIWGEALKYVSLIQKIDTIKESTKDLSPDDPLSKIISKSQAEKIDQEDISRINGAQEYMEKQKQLLRDTAEISKLRIVENEKALEERKEENDKNTNHRDDLNSSLMELYAEMDKNKSALKEIKVTRKEKKSDLNVDRLELQSMEGSLGSIGDDVEYKRLEKEIDRKRRVIEYKEASNLIKDLEKKIDDKKAEIGVVDEKTKEWIKFSGEVNKENERMRRGIASVGFFPNTNSFSNLETRGDVVSDEEILKKAFTSGDGEYAEQTKQKRLSFVNKVKTFPFQVISLFFYPGFLFARMNFYISSILRFFLPFTLMVASFSALFVTQSAISIRTIDQSFFGSSFNPMFGIIPGIIFFLVVAVGIVSTKETDISSLSSALSDKYKRYGQAMIGGFILVVLMSIATSALSDQSSVVRSLSVMLTSLPGYLIYMVYIYISGFLLFSMYQKIIHIFFSLIQSEKGVVMKSLKQIGYYILFIFLMNELLKITITLF